MSSNLIKTDAAYRSWIQEISSRFRKSQIKAAVKVNDEMLRFYWSLGRDIVSLSQNAGYGSDFYRSVSDDLKEIFPEVKSFSPTKLKYMRYFYEMYPDAGNRQQVVDDLANTGTRLQLSNGSVEIMNRQQAVTIWESRSFSIFPGATMCRSSGSAKEIRTRRCSVSARPWKITGPELFF